MSDVIDDTNLVVAVYDDQSPNWSPDPVINEIFLRCQKNLANDTFKARGYLFLNDVYDMLGLTRTSRGQLVGWLHSDNRYVEFWESELSEKGTIFLKFNVDGVIYDKLEERA